MARTRRDAFQSGGLVVGGLPSNLGPKAPTPIAPVPDQAPGPLYPPDYGRVRFRTIDRRLEFDAVLGQDPAEMIPQSPRVETVDTPWRMGQSWWSGQEVGTLALPIMFDGWPYRSVEYGCAAVELMLRPVAAGRASGKPTPVQIAGNVPGTDRVWMPVAPEMGESIWRDGYRVRQSMTLNFVQWQPVERADTVKRANPRNTKTGALKRRKSVTAKRGDTLATIAQRELGKASRWKDIARANPRGKGKAKKPRKSPTDVKVGEKLKLPQD